MSEKSVREFYEKVAESKELQEKLKALDKKEDINSAIGELVEIAKVEGFMFEPKDLKNARSKQPKTQEQETQGIQSAFEVVNRSDCYIEWPGCVETNASCVIADPTPPSNCSGHADLICSFGGSDEQNM